LLDGSNVGADAHDPAVARAPLDSPDPPAALQLLLHRLGAGAMPLPEPSQPGFATFRADFVQVPLDIGAHHGLEPSAGFAQIGDAGIEPAIVTVGQHVAVFVIEQHEPFRDRFDRVDQLLLRRLQRPLGLFELGDVGADADDPAVARAPLGQTRPAPVGALPLERLPGGAMPFEGPPYPFFRITLDGKHPSLDAGPQHRFVGCARHHHIRHRRKHLAISRVRQHVTIVAVE
jgi:hypothetical protein